MNFISNGSNEAVRYYRLQADSLCSNSHQICCCFSSIITEYVHILVLLDLLLSKPFSVPAWLQTSTEAERKCQFTFPTWFKYILMNHLLQREDKVRPMRLPAAIKSKYCLSFTCYPPKSISFVPWNKYFTTGTTVFSLNWADYVLERLKYLSPFEIGVTWPEKTEENGCVIPLCSKGGKITTTTMCLTGRINSHFDGLLGQVGPPSLGFGLSGFK